MDNTDSLCITCTKQDTCAFTSSNTEECGVYVPSEYPDDNPKTLLGMAKPPLRFIPPVAILEMGQAMADGGQKYGLMNYREKHVSSSVYYDAAMRHLLAWWDGEDEASDSGVKHLAHAMACMGILLDAESCGTLNDDRPYPGKIGERIKELTDG